MTKDQFANIAMKVTHDRRFSITLNLAFCLLFTGIGVLGVLEAPSPWNLGTAVNLWCGGIWFGYGLMSMIQPRITEKWKREMKAEMDKMGDEVIKNVNREMLNSMWSPKTAPDEPGPRRLQ